MKQRPAGGLNDGEKTGPERNEEGPCAPALGVGPYAAEAGTIDAMHAFASEHGPAWICAQGLGHFILANPTSFILHSMLNLAG